MKRGKKDTNEINIDGQISIFDILGIPDDLDRRFSSDELIDFINKVADAKDKAIKREKEEKRQKKEEERIRKEEEKRIKQEEHVREVTCMDLPMDWNNIFLSDKRTSGVHYDSISDALIHCLTTLGSVDIEFISSITGEDYKTVIETLKGAIYQNPDTWGEVFYKGWETADEYLSGNLIRKWKSAKAANQKYNGYFSRNIKAIERVLPPSVATEDIYITLGSPWVPSDIIDDFINDTFGPVIVNEYSWFGGKSQHDFQTKHDEITGTWEIPEKSRYKHNIAVSEVYGTRKLEALHILERTLNMKSIAITEEVKCKTNSSGKKKVINNVETVAAIEKQKQLIKHFQEWVWRDKNRKERLTTIYESKYSCIRRRVFDGSFLEFPGMSKDINLYPYQKDAVARIIFTPNTLLAHDVGAGKTYVMIAAGQELRRMGLSKKNMYVVPNNIVGQWERIFRTMYPDANILCISPNTFTPRKRESVLERIRDEDFDGIIIAYSCFEMIPVSKEYFREEIKESKSLIDGIINQKNKATSRLKKKQEALDSALAELMSAYDDMYDGVYFDELGITRLFVDEAHNFKNIHIDTKIENVLGISSAGSNKCKDMLDKVHVVQKKNNGKGVVMATGTPITNSITDAYVMQTYLQSGELAMMDLQNFDSWVGMFAEKRTDFEIDVDTNSYRMATRFSRFHNLPELTTMLAMIADFHQMDDSSGVPDFDGYTDTLIAKTDELTQFLQKISKRADDVRSGMVPRTEDNMLKITTDGRKAALDLRLVDNTVPYDYASKVAKCAENVAEIYFKTEDQMCTQLIFCDTSTPKQDFNIYDELRDRLEQLGIPGFRIAFIHDADTDKERSELFAWVRIGAIRVLIGSTFKLGLGVNVQNKLIALHHIDVPWRPADMTQREGRILRQGNTNKKVQIFRYITEGSFDAYSWQLLETKQRFISDLLSGSITERSGKDIEDAVLDYAEVKALAVGNPLVKERVEAQNELTRYLSLQKKTVDMRIQLEKEQMELPGKIKKQQEDIRKYTCDRENYDRWKKSNPPAFDNKTKEAEAEKRRNLRENLNKALKSYSFEDNEKVYGKYKGFNIILPAHMDKLKPYIWLQGSAKHYIEMSDSEVGNLVRIDNYLDSLDDKIGKYKDGLFDLEMRMRDIKNELNKNISYTDMIEFWRSKVDELDEKLEVEKNE